MTWRVVVTRDRRHADGAGPHQRTVVRELAYPPTGFDTEAEAEAAARRIRNAATDPTLDVAVEPPQAQFGAHQPPDRQAAAAGIAAARAALRGQP